MAARKYDAAFRDEAARLREDEKLSEAAICRRLGCSLGWLQSTLLELAADTPETAAKILPQTAPGPTVCQGKRTVRRFQVDEDAIILQMAADQHTPRAIGRALTPPRHWQSVRARLNTLARHEARREAAGV